MTMMQITADMSQDEVVQAYLADGWELYTDDGFIGLAGPFFVKPRGAADDAADKTANKAANKAEAAPLFHFPTFPKHHNRNGVLQGGALMTFTDRSMGATARLATDTPRTATVQLNTHFIDAVRIGEVVHTAPVIVRATKQIIFVNAVLMVGERTVATATGIWKKILSAG